MSHNHSSAPPAARPSAHLASVRAALGTLVDTLSPRFDFFSVLAADSAGTNFEALPGERRAAESMWTERGFVVRAARGGRVVERSFDTFGDGVSGRFADALTVELEALLAAAAPAGFLTVELAADADRAVWYPEVSVDPFDLSPGTILDRLEALRLKTAAASPLIAMARTRAEWVRVSKLYLSSRREFEQSYLWGQAYVFAAARRGEVTRQIFDVASGLKGAELLDELEASPGSVAALAVELLGAGPVEPGEHVVVLAPDVAGMLAHEAFGHGVETDMMAKGRSKAADFIGKRVGSPLVTMLDGARSAEQTGTFLFDDEGIRGTSTLVLEEGILRSGISDLLSARELGIPATGNGRRWSFERKAYARMTNTFFEAGTSSPEDLIAGVKSGWLLEHPNSGMEDPKNWGIQLVALVGREIKDGKLTGRIASPVVCTGYVPDVLSAVDAVSDRVVLKGNGYCGKGYKEFVKVSSGSPWMRTKMRLG